MILDFQMLTEIRARASKSVTPIELEMLKKWLEANEKLMDFKSQNDFKDTKEFDENFSDFHMDIYDIIKHNDPNYRN